MRDALAAYLDSRREFTAVGRTATVDGLYSLCLLRRPDVALIDAGLLSVDLVARLHGLHEAHPGVELVVAYTDLRPQAVPAAIQAGMTGLLASACGLEAMLRMLRRRATPIGRTAPDGLALTDRELQIISLLGAGHSVSEMAGLLGISRRTVENHKRRLYAKLGVGSRARRCPGPPRSACCSRTATPRQRAVPHAPRRGAMRWSSSPARRARTWTR